MKKAFAVLIFPLLATILFGCAQSEFINIDVFTQNFDSENGEIKLNLLDFEITERDSDIIIYDHYFETQEKKVLLRIFENSQQSITRCAVVLPKYDEGKNQKNNTSSEIDMFLKICKLTVSAYTGMAGEDAKQMLDTFEPLKSSQPEKTKEKTHDNGSFHYICISNEVCNELIIENKWLNEIESTQKPESRVDFGGSTGVRTETVPLR